MASVLAEVVLGKVSEMAIQQVVNQVRIVVNFPEHFIGLKDQIEQIDFYLNEADEKSTGQKDSVKKWLHRVRDIAWEAEDILQECAVNSLYATNTQSCTLTCTQLIFRHQMGRRIRKVKDKMKSVVDEGSKLNIVRAVVPQRDEAESSRRPEAQVSNRWSLLPTDSKPVGIQATIESVVRLLDDPEIRIIAVVGMGGIGKTYLLQHVYNSRKERYDKSAWLSISQFYSISKLQRDLTFQLDEDLNKKIVKRGISEVLAAELIHDFMLEKRCLIVLDDVWRARKEGDLPKKLGIPTVQTSQCKILVSTRNKMVFKDLKAEIYKMELLTEEQSWRLFCAYAFPTFEENKAPEELEDIAHKIMKKCGELALAVKITAASLASTTKLVDWKSKLSKLEEVGTSTDDDVMHILMLSYHSLPAHLKACFAYLSYFPEDEIIECEYLIYLWMGEGFIPAGMNPWDCLDQLLNLCLVEVWEEEWKLKKYCKIHDLLLDLAILISRENKCAFGDEDADENRWCRLFLAKKDIDEHAISERPPVSLKLVRTLSLSYNSKIGGNIPATLFSGMRALRVLDLSYTNICTLPASVGEMKLLKVLNLRETKIEKLPECVRYLNSLSFLDVSRCSGLEQSQVPKWISELKCLQHLEGPFRRMPDGISKLDSLRTLRLSKDWLSLSVEKNGILRLEDVGKMNEIEEIAFKVEDESQLKRMEEGILAPLKKMRLLQVNNQINGTQSDLPQFPQRMSAMTDLEHLSLYYFAVPSWLDRLTNLRYLSLWYCDCSDYPELKEMPSLVTLVLWWNKSCKKLPNVFGKSGGFRRLRFFSIRNFPELEEFPEMENGAMGCLEKLELQHCKKLNKVGDGLEQLRRLKEFSFDLSGTDQLRETLKEDGVYWRKMKYNNPEIIIKQ